EDVAGWFAAARCRIDAANPEVIALAGAVTGMQLADRLRQVPVPVPRPQRVAFEKLTAKTRSIQVALANLRRDLPWYLQCLEYLADAPESPEAEHLQPILAHVEGLRARAPYLFPSRQGPKQQPWQREAELLVDPIKRVFESAGHPNLTRRQGGALVTVL